MSSRIELFAFALAACHTGEASPAIDSELAATPSYDVVTVEALAPHWTDDIPGRVAFDETRASRIGSPLAGRVSKVMVELGDRVAAGTPLFSVDSGDLADLRNARRRALVDLDAATQNEQRVTALVDAGSLPRKELLSVQQDLAEARVALANAESKLASLKIQAGGATSFTVTAPRAGVIVDKHLAVAQQVSPDSGAVIAVADLDAVWLVTDLLEDAAAGIRPGSKAEIRIEGASDVTGVVSQVSAIVDPDRHTVPVRIVLDNSKRQLRPSSLARVKFLVGGDGALAVPSEALLSDGAHSYVYVLVAGAPTRRDVIAGPRNARAVTIRSGLAAGESIVSSGASLLDNQVVSP